MAKRPKTPPFEARRSASEKAHSSGGPRWTTTGNKISATVGIVAAMLAAVLLNVYVARHYKRWDVTQGGLYTLSDATKETLRTLEEPVTVYVLLSTEDPLALSVQHLLAGYTSESKRVTVQVTDPDRHPAEFLAAQQRFGLVAGKSDDGKIVADAAVVVVRGERPFFLTPRDLVAVDADDDTRARPRLEQAITGAIRSLGTGERPKICFTTGHGEPSLEIGGGQGLGGLRERLVKNNDDPVEIVDIKNTSSEDGVPIAACRVVVVAGPTERFAPADAARLRAYIEGGGNALFALGPQPDGETERPLDLGLDDVLATAGLRLEKDFVFERDPNLRITRGFGETFLPIAKPHATTDGLLKAKSRGLGVVMTVASSLSPTSAGVAAPVPLLVTSEKAFGMSDFFRWAKHPVEPAPTPEDRKGPLTVAYATELPKLRPTDAHGARIVVAASSGVLLGANWQTEELRGTALFVESALSWLTAQPVFLDIPNKPMVTAGLRVSEGSLVEVFRYVVIYMPLSTILFGVAVALRRRSRDKHPRSGGAGEPPTHRQDTP